VWSKRTGLHRKGGGGGGDLRFRNCTSSCGSSGIDHGTQKADWEREGKGGETLRSHQIGGNFGVDKGWMAKIPLERPSKKYQ